jgi:hypothetical protein
MIDALDNLLRHLFRSRIPSLLSDDQVRFQAPDNDWRSYVGTLTGIALNVYLVALTENTALRDNARERQYVGDQVLDTRAPRRLDCQYLLTAWSPIHVTSAFEPTLDEHALLYQVASTLVDAEPLVARRIYAPGPLPAGFPADIADVELPSLVLAADAFSKTAEAEFWGSVDSRWRPGIYLTVTLPVPYVAQGAGPAVLTRLSSLGTLSGTTAGPAAAPQVLTQIGGQVSTGVPPAPVTPVAGAWVRLESVAGAALRTVAADGLGRFTLAGLAPGSYILRVRAAGFAEAARPITIPAAPGGYDVQLS